MAAVLLLSLLALVAAVAVAGRASMDSRSERLLAATIVWLALTQLPTYGLAWVNRLYPAPLAILVAVLSLGTLAASGLGRSPRAHARAVLSDLLGFLRLPFDGLVLLARVRSFVFIGALSCLVIVVWTAWLSYLAPPSGWDGLWYHDTIVGYAMQNHGFRMVEISDEHWPVNSFPRMCENVGLWFVAFGDRRLLELPSSLLAVPLFVGVYVMARRYIEDRVYALGCASAILLMPGMALILRSTYIDLVMAAFYVLAVQFATRPVLRMRDAWLAATALGLLLGSKLMAIGTVPWVALIVVVRLLWHHGRKRPGATTATLVGGTVWLLAIGAPSYVRNWILFGSPMWPWGLDVAALHIHWPGRPQAVVRGVAEPGSFFGTLLTPPVPGKDWPDSRQHGYGLALTVLMLPLGALALLLASLKAAAGIGQRDRETGPAWNLVYTAIPALAWLPISPDLAMARYNVHVVIVLVIATAWLLSRADWVRAREAIVGATIFFSLVLMYWATPGWNISFGTALDLAGMTTKERAAAHVFDFLPEPKVAEARDTELKRGDVVVYTTGVLFPALCWNENYSNRVEYVPSTVGPEGILQRARELRAKWIVVSSHSIEHQALRSRADWQEIGALSTTLPAMVAFRHVGI
jgi:hypothetical protein